MAILEPGGAVQTSVKTIKSVSEIVQCMYNHSDETFVDDYSFVLEDNTV